MSRTAVFHLLSLLMDVFLISCFVENFQEITIKQPLTVLRHSPKVVGIDKQMCKQDTRLLGNVSGVYSRVVFFECLL